MINNFFTLRHIAGTLDISLKGAAIEGAFSQERDVLVIAMEEGKPHFLVSCRGDFPTCYLDERMIRAHRNTADVLPALIGQTILSVTICPGDRVMTAAFTSGRRLVMHFFGTKSNALVVGDDGMVIDAFRDAKSLANTPYDEPTDRPILSPDELVSQIQVFPQLELALALRKVLPALGSTLATEIVFRAELATSTLAHDLADGHRHAVRASAQAVFDDLASPSPRIYLGADGGPRVLSIIPLTHLEPSEQRAFSSIHGAVQTYYALRRSTARRGQQEAQVRGTLEGARDRAARTLAAMRKDEEEHDRASLYQDFGSLLMTHMGTIPAGATTYVPSLHDRQVTIPLDPHLTPVQNAQRYFEKAKHARLSRQQAAERTGVLQRRIAAATTLLQALEGATTREALDAFMKDRTEDLEEFGIGRKGPIPREVPFRTFVVDGGFEVWAGKDNTSNDDLTLHHAKPNDLWFHARGCPGSHVVLRIATGNGVPGKRSKQEAAAIAAYYSKMRNARMVPVTMTERKYVRKPRGAAPGSVVVTHEDTLFAEPRLPKVSSKHPSSD
jgi:predicted ribosome quality control (RQC) complex YloA/Tae2 family protein